MKGESSFESDSLSLGLCGGNLSSKDPLLVLPIINWWMMTELLFDTFRVFSPIRGNNIIWRRRRKLVYSILRKYVLMLRLCLGVMVYVFLSGGGIGINLSIGVVYWDLSSVRNGT